MAISFEAKRLNLSPTTFLILLPYTKCARKQVKWLWCIVGTSNFLQRFMVREICRRNITNLHLVGVGLGRTTLQPNVLSDRVQTWRLHSFQSVLSQIDTNSIGKYMHTFRLRSSATTSLRTSWCPHKLENQRTWCVCCELSFSMRRMNPLTPPWVKFSTGAPNNAWMRGRFFELSADSISSAVE